MESIVFIRPNDLTAVLGIILLPRISITQHLPCFWHFWKLVTMISPISIFVLLIWMELIQNTLWSTAINTSEMVFSRLYLKQKIYFFVVVSADFLQYCHMRFVSVLCWWLSQPTQPQGKNRIRSILILTLCRDAVSGTCGISDTDLNTNRNVVYQLLPQFLVQKYIQGNYTASQNILACSDFFHTFHDHSLMYIALIIHFRTGPRASRVRGASGTI